MGFFKNIFGNKSEDETPSTSQSGQERTADAAEQPAEANIKSPLQAAKSSAQSAKDNADLKAVQKIPKPAVEQHGSPKAKEKSEPGIKTEPKRADSPPPLNNVVQLKSVSVSSAPPTAKQHKVTPPEPPKDRPRDAAKATSSSHSVRDSQPKVSQSDAPTRASDKKPEQSRGRALGQDARDSSPIYPSKAKEVSAGQPERKTQTSASQLLKEKLIASADVTNGSRNGAKPRTGARVFRTAMMQAKQKSIPPKEPEIDSKSAVELAIEHAAHNDNAPSSASQAFIENEGKRRELETVFTEVAQKKAKAIRDFALELSLGLTPKNWVSYCLDAVQAIARAADGLKRMELQDALAQFKQQLDQANQQSGPNLSPTSIAELRGSHAKLAEQMPEGCALGDISASRERLLVESLLLQVPGVGRNIVKQIEPKPIGKYRALCTADAKEIARQTGLDHEVAGAVAENFNAFQKSRESSDPESRLERLGRGLAELSQQLDRLHREFVRADAEGDRERKRNARREQASRLAQIEVLLADYAELELLRSLRPLPVQKKIEALNIFLDEPSSSHSAIHDSSPASKAVSG
ncbi:MAG: hypothetical protein JXA30_03555 [Deltaproteobacteria bacterium]|nr:hypothetical protein [Deltaproteobacteria bacterium]